MKLSLGLSPRDYSVAGGVTYDADAQAYFTANTAITSDAAKNAINTFYLGLKSDGIYTKIKAMYLPIWGSASASKWNLKDPRDLDAAFRLTFATGMTFNSGGMTSNGTSGYANSNLTPSTDLLLDSVHLSFYSRTNDTAATKFDMGCYSTSPSTSYTELLIKSSDTTSYLRINDASGGTGWASQADSRGFFMGTRSSSTTLNFYKNGTLSLNKTVNSSVRPNQKIYILARNANGLANNYSLKQCSFSSIGDSLTSTEVTNFYNRVNTLMTYFGINV